MITNAEEDALVAKWIANAAILSRGVISKDEWRRLEDDDTQPDLVVTDAPTA